MSGYKEVERGGTRLPPEDVAAAGSATRHVDPDGAVRLIMPTLKLGFIGFM